MFQMNAERLKKCMDRGGTREQCMKEVYPERGGTKKKSKKAPERAPRGGRRYS